MLEAPAAMASATIDAAADSRYRARHNTLCLCLPLLFD